MSFITRTSIAHRNKVLSCWDYKEKIDEELAKGKLKMDSIPIKGFISQQYYSDNKVVKIYFAAKYKNRIEESNYYFRNDSMIIGRFYVYFDSNRTIQDYTATKANEVYTSFIYKDTMIYEAWQHPSIAHPNSGYLAVREYEHANCVTLNRLNLRYPCPNNLLPKQFSN